MKAFKYIYRNRNVIHEISSRTNQVTSLKYFRRCSPLTFNLNFIETKRSIYNVTVQSSNHLDEEITLDTVYIVCSLELDSGLVGSSPVPSYTYFCDI